MLDFEKEHRIEQLGYRSDGVLSQGYSGSNPAQTGQKPARGTHPAGEMGSLLAHCLAQSLDHVGRGMLLVGPASQLLYANRLAKGALAGSGHALRTEDGRVTARSARDQKLLAEALDAALRKGRRCMLTLGCGAAESDARAASEPGAGAGAGTLIVAILPIETLTDPEQEAGLAPAAGGQGSRPPRAQAVLISLPQCSHHKNLAVSIFAREHGCTPAETQVLEALLAGQTPEVIALERDVALSTVRTQIGQLRQKTGCRRIRALLDVVASLPPMMVLVQ